MTGHLQIKGDKFYIVINIVDRNGKPKRKWISTGLNVAGNRRKAEKMLRETISEYEKKYYKVGSDILFSDYIREWLKRKKNRIHIVTYEGYSSIATRMIIPHFEEKETLLVDVDRKMLQSYFDDLYQNGRTIHGKEISATSLRRYKNIINQTLKEAVKDDLIPSNPCEYVDLPKVEKHNSNFYNAQQIKVLFEAIKGDPLENLIKITVLYGLRRSEVLGIKWDSIDFEERRLEIKHTVVTMMTTVEKDKTKNSSSHRTYTLTDEALEIFKEEKLREQKNRELFGASYQECDYVFKWDDGRPYPTDYVTKHFSKLLKRHGLPHIRFHELRHSCASLLLNNGYTLKDVSEYMGHANIKMTADIYGHLDSLRKITLSEGISKDIF